MYYVLVPESSNLRVRISDTARLLLLLSPDTSSTLAETDSCARDSLRYRAVTVSLNDTISISGVVESENKWNLVCAFILQAASFKPENNGNNISYSEIL